MLVQRIEAIPYGYCHCYSYCYMYPCSQLEKEKRDDEKIMQNMFMKKKI